MSSEQLPNISELIEKIRTSSDTFVNSQLTFLLLQIHELAIGLESDDPEQTPTKKFWEDEETAQTLPFVLEKIETPPWLTFPPSMLATLKPLGTTSSENGAALKECVANLNKKIEWGIKQYLTAQLEEHETNLLCNHRFLIECLGEAAVQLAHLSPSMLESGQLLEKVTSIRTILSEFEKTRDLIRQRKEIPKSLEEYLVSTLQYVCQGTLVSSQTTPISIHKLPNQVHVKALSHESCHQLPEVFFEAFPYLRAPDRTVDPTQIKPRGTYVVRYQAAASSYSTVMIVVESGKTSQSQPELIRIELVFALPTAAQAFLEILTKIIDQQLNTVLCQTLKTVFSPHFPQDYQSLFVDPSHLAAIRPL